jgi:transcription initiation factor TFIIIB Brf1 subunit/transcription initiation factor TFIIB
MTARKVYSNLWLFISLTALPESKQIPLYKPIYVYITHEISLPPEPESKLEVIDKASGLTKAEGILEFCRVPRACKEIYGFLGMTSRGYIKETYIDPLVENGRLRLTIPNYASNIQRYVNAESEVLIPTDEAILDFCKIPRLKSDIARHFGLTYFVARKHYDPLIESGRLVGDTPELPKNNWQKFIAAGTEYTETKDEKHKYSFVKSDRVLGFCQTPKNRTEIAEYFGIHLRHVFRYIKPLVEDGRLKMTKPNLPSSIDQRFVATGAEADILVLSNETIIAFCSMPRTRKEIAEHFELKRYLAERYINELVKNGKLKMTMPINPDCKQQGFVDSAVEVMIFSVEALLEYCQTPRSKEEIQQHFGVSTKGALKTFIDPLLENGKLKRTIPEYPTHKWQRFVSGYY